MYHMLNACQQKYTRLVESLEDETISCVQEEIEYVFHPSEMPVLLTTLAIQKRNYHVCDFDEQSRILYSIAKKQLRQSEDVILADTAVTNLNNIRMYIIDLLKYHRYLLVYTKYGKEITHLASFQGAMLKFTDLPENALHKLIASVSKQSDSAINDYFHLQLDILWLFLTVDKNETTLNKIFKQLNYLTFKCYEKYNKYTVICKCMKSIWLRIQLYCEYTNIPFWNKFNTSLECYDEVFILYHLQFMANLQCYSEPGIYIGSNCSRVLENIDFLNKIWSQFMKSQQEASEDKVVKLLQLVEPLLSDLWLSHVTLDFYYLTWDYYYRKFDDVKISQSFNEIMEDIFYADVVPTSHSPSKAARNVNGYVLFNKMMRRHLQRHPNHWKKFKGRIYTKFPPPKFAKLTDQGLHNFAILFFAVTPGNFDEITGKFLGLLKELPEDRQMTLEVWNIYIYMIKIFLDNNRIIEPVYIQFEPLLKEAVGKRTLFYLFSDFVKNLSSAFLIDDLTLKQSLLISEWLENYLKSCPHNELIGLLNTLAMIIEKTVEAGVWYDYQNQFVNHVLNTIKTLNLNQPIIGTVAGLIVANCEGLENVVEEFTQDHVPGEVMVSFFMTLRRKSLYSSNEKREVLTIKAWFLSWMIGAQNIAFTKEILELIKCTESRNVFEDFLINVSQEVLVKCLKDSEKFFAKNTNLYLYTNSALIFNYCGRYIYNKTTTNCFLSVFVDQFLLPDQVQRGVKPSFLPLVENTWHLFIQSLWKLNEDSDPYLERLIKDLTIRYLPHFNTRPSPLVKVLRDRQLTEFVFKKVAAEFFNHNKMKYISDEQLFKPLNAINNTLDEARDDDLFVLFAKCFLFPLYEVYMFKNHKVLVVEIIKKLAARISNNELSAQFTESITTLTKKHLPLNTNNYFQVVYMLVKIVRGVVQGLLGMIKNDIALLESRRGQGVDNSLRQSYVKLSQFCK